MSKSLYQKMGIKEGDKLAVINAPDLFHSLYKDVPFFLKWSEDAAGVDIVHFFPHNISELENQLHKLQDLIDKDGMIWVSWFKKASKILSELTEDIIRDTALNLKLVDVKVCSVNEQYSGLKLVIRKHLR